MFIVIFIFGHYLFGIGPISYYLENNILGSLCMWSNLGTHVYSYLYLSIPGYIDAHFILMSFM